MDSSLIRKSNVLPALLLSFALIQGCGKSSDPMNIALPDVQAPEDSSELNLAEGPSQGGGTTLSLTGETGSSPDAPTVEKTRENEKSLSQMALNFVRGYELPLFLRFPDTGFVADQKADWLVGARCKLLLARMARVKSTPTNLYPLVPQSLCSNPILGQKAEIVYVPGRYISRRDVSVGMISTDSKQTEVMLRKDLSVGAIREVTDKPKLFGSTQHVQITVSTDKLIGQSTKFNGTDRLEVRAADGSMLYVSNFEKSAVLKRNVTTKTIDIKKFGHYKIKAREVAKSSLWEVVGLKADDSIECTVSVLNSAGKLVDEAKVSERCFHAR